MIMIAITKENVAMECVHVNQDGKHKLTAQVKKSIRYLMHLYSYFLCNVFLSFHLSLWPPFSILKLNSLNIPDGGGRRRREKLAF